MVALALRVAAESAMTPPLRAEGDGDEPAACGRIEIGQIDDGAPVRHTRRVIHADGSSDGCAEPVERFFHFNHKRGSDAEKDHGLPIKTAAT